MSSTADPASPVGCTGTSLVRVESSSDDEVVVGSVTVRIDVRRTLLRSSVEVGADDVDVPVGPEVDVCRGGFGVTCGEADEGIFDVTNDPGTVGFARSVATESAVGGSTIPKTPVRHFDQFGSKSQICDGYTMPGR